jgi:RNA polymerase sigma-70 factor (ECF subfamily)
MSNQELLNEKLFFSIKEQIASGSQPAFRQLYEFYSKKLIHFAYLIVKQKDAAMEIVDEVFIKIWKQREHIPEISNLKVYLYTAVKNTSLNYLSRKAKEQQTEPFDFINIQLNDESSPEQRLITSEIYQKIKTVVNDLPPRCKMVFKLVREDGLKYREVAAILNISENTVDSQMVIAVSRISEAVKGQFDFFPSKAVKK